MIVKDFLSVVAGGARVFIKPPAKGLYYDGTAGDVPKSLMSATIEEISPRIYENDADNVNRYRGELGIWVRPIPEFDALCAGIEDYSNFGGESIDSFYCFLMEDHDQRMKELQEMAEERNRLKPTLSDYELRCAWPDRIRIRTRE